MVHQAERASVEGHGKGKRQAPGQDLSVGGSGPGSGGGNSGAPSGPGSGDDGLTDIPGSDSDTSEGVFTWWDAIEHFVAGHPSEKLDEVLYWSRAKFELLYASYVKRTVIDELRSEQRAQVRAVVSNGGYLQSEQGLNARKETIESINSQFNKMINNIQDPGKNEREDRALRENPLFAAGIRGLDRLKWDFQGMQENAMNLRAQGL